MMDYVLLLLAIAAPFIFSRMSLPAWLSSVLLCYTLGLLMSAVVGTPVQLAALVHGAIQGCVALAIPAMLLQASWSRVAQLGRPGFLSGLALWVGALLAALALMLMQVAVDKVAMMFAIFTGGLANLQAAGLAFGLEAQELVAANLGDVVAGGVLFLTLSSFGPVVLNKLLPQSPQHHTTIHSSERAFSGNKKLTIVMSLVLATACLGIALGVVQVLKTVSLEGGSIGENYKELLVLGVASFLAISLGQVIERKGVAIGKAGADTGEYLMLVFCVLIGWTADWSQVGASSLWWAGSMAAFLSIQLIVAIGLANYFRLEADLFLIALVGSVYSPAFVPPIASRIKRKDLVAAGVLIGLIGLALATPIAILFAEVFA